MLKYASDPKDNEWTAAWNKTQPKTVFETRFETGEDD